MPGSPSCASPVDELSPAVSSTGSPVVSSAPLLPSSLLASPGPIVVVGGGAVVIEPVSDSPSPLELSANGGSWPSSSPSAPLTGLPDAYGIPPRSSASPAEHAITNAIVPSPTQLHRIEQLCRCAAEVAIAQPLHVVCTWATRVAHDRAQPEFALTDASPRALRRRR